MRHGNVYSEISSSSGHNGQKSYKSFFSVLLRGAFRILFFFTRIVCFRAGLTLALKTNLSIHLFIFRKRLLISQKLTRVVSSSRFSFAAITAASSSSSANFITVNISSHSCSPHTIKSSLFQTVDCLTRAAVMSDDPL